MDLSDVVTLEPGLAARVVRLANSVHFGRGAKVENIVEAIQRVGMVSVRELVTFAVASQMVGRPLATYNLDAHSLWSRAVACALAAASLAERADIDRASAYTAGLMHGLGLIVIDRYASTLRTPRKLASSGYPLDFAPAERAWLKYSHAETGGALLELWGFAEGVTEAVRFQLEPDHAPEPHRKLAMVLATARWARSLFCVPEEKIPELPPAEWLAAAGIKIDDFGVWLGEVKRGYLTARDELKIG